MARRWCRFVLLGMIGVSGVGCVSSEKPPPPLGLTPGLQSKLGAKSDASAPPSSFDPTATGGKGTPAANAFNRPKPAGSGMGVSLPPPQLASNSTAPMVSAPVQPGVSVAPPSADVTRSSMPALRAAEPIQPPTGGTLPPPTEPPVTRANYPQPSAPPPSVNLSVPMTDPDPMPRPIPPPPPAAAPIAPDGPAPLSPLKSAADGPLPGGPLAPIEPLKPR